MVSKQKPIIPKGTHPDFEKYYIEKRMQEDEEEYQRMIREKYEQQQQEQEQEQEQPDEKPNVKPKRVISDAQRESLGRAREMAQLKKKEMKELTEKKKIIQHLKKEENKIDIEDEYNKTIERVVTKKQPKEIIEKPKPERKIKKIIYEDEEEEEKPKVKEFSYVENTRKSAMQQMQDKINEDRMRFLYQKYILR